MEPSAVPHTTLKRAEEADQPLLLELMAEYYRFDRLPFDAERARAALHRLLQDSALGDAWLVRAGSEPVGYVVLTLGYSLEYQGRDAFVDELYIRAAFRRRGCGRRALALVEAEARRWGVRALHLEVERKNRGAQAFYRKAGYGDHDRYLMTKRIAQGDP